jgi:HEPN domain-containing protein
MASDPLDIFVVADQFWHATDYLRRRKKNDVQNPIIACAAFALELYLKCLFVMEGGQPTNEHNLKKLFRKLSQPVQTEIRSYFSANSGDLRVHLENVYQRRGKNPPKGDLFDFALRVSKNAFMNFRYLFEHGLPAETGWVADMIVEGARHAILRRQPDWAEAWQVTPASVMHRRVL